MSQVVCRLILNWLNRKRRAVSWGFGLCVLKSSLLAQVLPEFQLEASAAAKATQTKSDAVASKTIDLTLKIVKNSVSIELRAPLDALLSFNRTAKAGQEKEEMAKALAVLKSEALLFTFPSASQCSLQFTSMNSDITERTLQKKPGSAHEIQQDGTGGILVAEYSGVCEKPASIGAVETSLFTVFPQADQIVFSVNQDGKVHQNVFAAPKPRGPIALALSQEKGQKSAGPKKP